MNWTALKELSQIEKIVEESTNQRILIFKHSTSCSISRTTLDRLERNWKEEELGKLKPYYLDLLNFRNISHAIAQKFDVEHESPQVLIIENGKSIYDQSHFGIDYKSVKEFSNAS
ncbi:MAG TPA: bacillithiol system redox-active protein YtxJ [Chryseolinea sp.]|nr:bacillithiol system redox-active protein YtxJ [Chryseolinea sp.]HPH47309.1 bacillithiol system redox-active protein YtxJ [Chryseolinea sp.]HPM30788.1 bacillithiol system redox-active protein YtxJ [Chryseolinea sp.]